MIWDMQQKLDEDPSEFLERIYQVYRNHINSDPEVPENFQMVNLSFIGQSTSDIRKKLQHLDRAWRMNPSQLVNIGFKVYNAREARK